MVWRRERERKGDATVAFIAGLAHETGDVSTALSMALSGLASEQRVEVLRTVVDRLPPLVRAIIWGDAAMSSGGWEEVKAILTAEERRPRTVEALVERGRQKCELDLNLVPLGAELRMHVYRRGASTPPPDRLPIAVEQVKSRELELRALGRASFETDEDIHLPYGTGEVIVAAGRSVVLGSLDVQEHYVSTVRYGKPLVAVFGETIIPFMDVRRTSNLEHCFLGSVLLDNQPVFTGVA
ncbi:MAG TPA: hypothetical protein VJ836_05475 [Candidatus Saccharimonadales bacterium]|nr:hypothetical protein [Candidatus Saccharimonadales bacterium]